MATAEAQYDPTIGGTSAPVVIDGTGLASTVPLLIKNGKTLSGLELQVTGSAATGVVFEDSSGVRQGAIGLAVSAGDWVANAAAGDVVVTGPASAGTKRLLLKNLSSGGIQLLSPASTGTGNSGWLRLDDTSGAELGYGTSKLLFNGTNGTFAGPMAVSASTSVASVALQVAGDINTGIGAVGGADTLSGVAGGTEVWRFGNGTFGIFTKIAAPAVQQTSGANVTNSVTSGGTDDTIANYTDLTIYANDAAAIRNDIYQLARKVKQINDGLRLLGWFT